MKTRPFNAEEYRRNPDINTIIYRDGTKPIAIYWIKEATQSKYPLISVTNNGYIHTHTKYGIFNENVISDQDLCFIVKEPAFKQQKNGYITVEGSGRMVVHQDDLGSIPNEATNKDTIASELVANAYLIAASPALFLALENFLQLDISTAKDANRFAQRAKEELLAVCPEFVAYIKQARAVLSLANRNNQG